MPRPLSAAPRIQEHHGYDRIWYRDRYYHLGKSGSKEAKASYLRLLAVWAEDPFAVPRTADDYLVVELFRDYLATDPAERFQVARARDIFGILHAETSVREFGSVELTAWQRWLCDRKHPKGERLYSKGYVTKLVGIVRRVYRWGVANRNIPPSQFEAMRAVRGPRPGQVRLGKRVTAVSDEHFTAAVLELPEAARGLICLIRHTGARPGELFGLRPCDVDPSDWAYVPASHKTGHRGHERVIYFGRIARLILARNAPQDDDRPYFTHRFGGIYNRNSLRLALGRACARAGVPKWTAYQCRHARLTEVRNALGIEAAQAVGGHKSARMTEHYTQTRLDLAAKAAAESG